LTTLSLAAQSNTKYTAEGGLYQRLTLSFGYLNKRGYCNGGACAPRCTH